MKKVLFVLMLLFSSSGFTQNEEIYDDEWYVSLDETINFVIFPNPTEERTIQFRVYRGFEESYSVKVTDATGKMVYEQNLCRYDELNLEHLKRGVYYVTACDEYGNQVIKRLILN